MMTSGSPPAPAVSESPARAAPARVERQPEAAAVRGTQRRDGERGAGHDVGREDEQRPWQHAQRAAMDGVDQQHDDDDSDPQTRARREHPARAHRPQSLRHGGVPRRTSARHASSSVPKGSGGLADKPPENGPNGPSSTSCCAVRPVLHSAESRTHHSRRRAVRVGGMTRAKLPVRQHRPLRLGRRPGDGRRPARPGAAPAPARRATSRPDPSAPSCERDLRAGLFDRPRRSMPDPVPIHLPAGHQPRPVCGCPAAARLRLQGRRAARPAPRPRRAARRVADGRSRRSTGRRRPDAVVASGGPPARRRPRR